MAFLYSLFLGPLGADQFYLGYGLLGCLKFLSLGSGLLGYLVADQFYLGYWLLGGLGVWWIFDVIRIGSAPVFANEDFRVSPDLAHAAFVLAFGSFCCFLGFGVALLSAAQHRSAKRKQAMLRYMEEEVGAYAGTAVNSAPVWRGASGDGAGRSHFVDL